MKILMKSKWFACLLAVVFAVSCGDSKNDDGGGGGGDGFNDSKLTPDEHKEKLEKAGLNFLKEFDAKAHEKALVSIKELSTLMEDGTFDEFLPEVFLDIESVIEENNIQKLVALASPASDVYKLPEDGIYTYNPDTKKWDKAEATGKIELVYTINGVKSILTVGHSNKIQIIKEVTDAEIRIPEWVEISLAAGGENQFNLKVEMKLADDHKSANISSNLSLTGGYMWKASAVVNGDEANVDFIMGKQMNAKSEGTQGRTLIAASANVKGKKLTGTGSYDPEDPGYIDPEDDADNILDGLQTGTFRFAIMDVMLKGEGNIRAMIDELDALTGEDQAKAENEAKIWNKNAQIGMYYNDTKEKAADIKMFAYMEERKVWEWDPNADTGFDWDGDGVNEKGNSVQVMKMFYETEPRLVFTSDGSAFSFESYFERTDFNSLIDAAEKLVNDYGKILDCDPVDFK